MQLDFHISRKLNSFAVVFYDENIEVNNNINMEILTNANIIKAKFISKILDGEIKLFADLNLLIGQEVMFGKYKTFADLVVLYKEKLYAFEIKAQNDNFKRLATQIENYRKIFDYIYIIITENHKKAIEQLDYCKNVGICIINNDNFEIIKYGILQKSFSKEDILETIPSSFLLKKYNLKRNMSAGEIRTNLMKKSQKDLKQTLLDYFTYKIEYKYKNFLEDKGDAIQYEDISLLSILNAKVLK